MPATPLTVTDRYVAPETTVTYWVDTMANYLSPTRAELNAGTASLLATAVNPAVGLGTFLAQLLLRSPLQNATTQEFRITGSWADPQVNKIEAPQRR